MGSAKAGAAKRSAAFALCLTVLFQRYVADAYQLTVHRKECVSEFVPEDGDIVSGSFVVVDRHYHWYPDADDIEMVITGPSGEPTMSAKAKGGKKFQFKARKLGYYKICFFNPTSGFEVVELSLRVDGAGDPQELAKDEHFNPLEAVLVRLREAVGKVTLEQQYYKARDARHKLTNESTKRRLLWYTLMEYLALILFSVAQVLLIQRLFRKRIGYNKI